MKKKSFTEKTFNFFNNFQCDFYKKMVIFEEISSTNTKAKELANNNEVEGTIVISKKQLEGRGRNNRIWQSPEETSAHNANGSNKEKWITER